MLADVSAATRAMMLVACNELAMWWTATMRTPSPTIPSVVPSTTAREGTKPPDSPPLIVRSTTMQ
jgi:hypothetical protein